MPMIWLNNWGWDMIMTHVTEHQKKKKTKAQNQKRGRDIEKITCSSKIFISVVM